MRALIALLALCTPCLRGESSPFATRILDYQPAPGQFVQNPAYNDPARALGPPVGGGLSSPDNSKVVTLGGFGGSITLGFNHSVHANPHNPLGMDAIIYGNSLYIGGDPQMRHSECGIVEIARDANGNGLADDPWFLIPGSHLPTGAILSSTTKNWDSATLNPAWIPPGRSGVWTTSTYQLSGAPIPGPIMNNPNPQNEAVWGYADVMPTVLLGDTDADGVIDDPGADAEVFYTLPDDPTLVGATPGSGGGVAFRIAWAIDAATGQAPVPPLDRFDFIRVSTGVDHVAGPLGEVSVEIGAVADVRPFYSADWNHSDGVGVQDLFDFLADWFAGTAENGGADFNNSGATSVQDLFDYLAAWFEAS